MATEMEHYNELKSGGTRLDKFLAKISGEDVGELTPKTKMERHLNEIAQNGSSGGGGGGGVFVVYDNDGTLDKTFAEILNAAQTGIVYLYRNDRELSELRCYHLASVCYHGKGRQIRCIGFTDAGTAYSVKYGASNDTDYPTEVS
jgi:hypothetical protein